MLSGVSFLIVFVIAIAGMIVAICALRVHPFLSIMATTLLLALLCLKPDKVVETTTAGFSSAFASIGLIVFAGSLIGLILEHTGGALKMSDVVIKFIGPKRPNASLLMTGWLTSIVIFCDSGFILLNPSARGNAGPEGQQPGNPRGGAEREARRPDQAGRRTG